MKKKKKLKRLFLLLILIPILFFITLFMPDTFMNTKYNNNYDFVQSTSITNMNARIIDIGILGSHDSATAGINMKSKPNSNESGIITSGIVNKLAKGLVVRMSKTQTANIHDQLYAGTRYLDIRVTKIDDEYYTCHGYLSYKLEEVVVDVLEFLDTHPGEFIIFDIQAFYTKNGKDRELDDEEFIELYNYINSIKSSNNSTLSDYIRYDANTDLISNLTYGMLTNNKTEGGILMLAKVDGIKEFYFRDKDASYKSYRIYYDIRSYWHETNSMKELMNGIKYENEYIKEQGLNDVLRVNQALRTGFFTNAKIIKSLFNWSLLNMAKTTNKKVIANKDDFMEWLNQMPIFLVDEVTSNVGNFNKLANEYIMEFNSKL